MTGLRFGRLTVLAKSGNAKGGAALWLCRCDCGRETNPRGADLRFGKATRCKPCATVARSTTHGGKGTRLYRIWNGMRTRCTNQNVPGYANYGGRGITVCDEWGDFATFRDWALGHGYHDSLSIERLDNDAGYAPANCTWAGRLEQSRNRRFVAKAPDGRPWYAVARSNGITNPAYRTRLMDGWSHEEAANWPMHKRRPQFAPSVSK